MGRKIGGFGGGLYAVLNLIGGINFCALVGPKKGFFGGTGAKRVLMGEVLLEWLFLLSSTIKNIPPISSPFSRLYLACHWFIDRFFCGAYYRGITRRTK